MIHSYSENGIGANLPLNTQQKHLIESHFDLVKSLARKMMNRNRHRASLSENDLISAGDVGLIEAAYHYDSKRNYSFNAYVTKCIWNAMVAEINWWFPSHSIEIVEIVNGVPVYVKKKEDLFSRVGESECYPNPSVCCDWKTEEDSLYETLDEALSYLDNKERRLICAKFGYEGKEMKLREMADENGVSVQAIHKRCNNTVSKLRTFFEGANPSYSMCA